MGTSERERREIEVRKNNRGRERIDSCEGVKFNNTRRTILLA